LFLAESKKLLDLEGGRASIPTIQGLYSLFIVSCCSGTDRAGSMYRYATFEMVKRMKLEKKYAKLSDKIPSEAREKLVIAKTLWGLFCFERYVLTSYVVSSRARVIFLTTLSLPLGGNNLQMTSIFLNKQVY
jgi:hypothetical protein